MDTALKLEALEVDTLREMINIASGHAATALGQMTDRRIMITVPGFAVTTLHDVPALLGYEKTRVVVIAMRMLGDAAGSLVFLVPEERARQLSACLLGLDPAPPGGLDPMARSSLTETANILAGAYASALATLTGRLVMLSVPVFGLEPPDGVLAGQWVDGRGDQLALCVETKLTFDADSPDCGGHMLLLPNEKTLAMLLEGVNLSS